MIDRFPPVLSVVRQCELVSVNRSGLYHEPSGETALNLALMRLIDAPCDHGFIAAGADDGLLALFVPEGVDATAWLAALRARLAAEGAMLTLDTRLGTKLYVVPFQPTAECLAKHWFELLAGPVGLRSGGTARLVAVRVWETPNCMAEYAPG